MPLSRLAITEAASWYTVVGWASAGAGGIGGCAPGTAGGEEGAAAGAVAVAAVDAGTILSVSRSMSLTFCTIESHRLFCAATSITEMAPVALGPALAVPVEPNCVEAVDCIFTLRDAL